jgi:glutathione peroxidase
MEKVHVNGPEISNVYKYLKSSSPNFTNNDDITWNFAKFLVNREGKVIKYFAPKDNLEELRNLI